MRISDWSSDVCSSDLRPAVIGIELPARRGFEQQPDLGRKGIEVGAADRAVLRRIGGAEIHHLAQFPAGIDAPCDQRPLRTRAAADFDKIGWASCKDRGCPTEYVTEVAVSSKQKQ